MVTLIFTQFQRVKKNKCRLTGLSKAVLSSQGNEASFLLDVLFMTVFDLVPETRV